MGNVAAVEAASKSSGSSSFTFLILILLVFVAVYFMMIRPQRRRREAAVQTQNTVAPGAQVRTTAGMYATVTAVDGDDVVLEVAPGVEVRYMKRAIMEVITPGNADAAADEHDEYSDEYEPEDDAPAEDAEDTDEHEPATDSHDDLAASDKHNVS
jgi:preprotein translocase subunit YajC